MSVNKMQKYDKNYPLDTIKVSEIPQAIREKANMIMEDINSLENDRVSNDLGTVDEKIKVVFLNNSYVESGLYMKLNDSWIGCGNIPANGFGLAEDGQRITIDKQSYSFTDKENAKIWSLSNTWKPAIFYDLFETFGTNEELLNRGIFGSIPKLKIFNVTKSFNSLLPVISTTKTTNLRTTTAYEVKNSFTFSALFSNISREYSDTKEIIDVTFLSVLMFFKDIFENVKCGLAYDHNNELYWIDQQKKTKINFTINPNTIYQMSIRMLNNEITILINDKEVYKTTNLLISNKQYLFSVCEDMNFGYYANASATVGEIQLFTEALTVEENSWNKNFPRTWDFRKVDNYLDLTLEERLKLKEILQEIA